MNEREFCDLLTVILEDCQEQDFDEQLRSVRSFEDVGLLTDNEGLVVRLRDGSEFQLTVVRSR